MCPYCKEIMEVWNTEDRGKSKAPILARKVPWHLEEIDRYFDKSYGTLVYVMRCNHCGEIFRIPH